MIYNIEYTLKNINREKTIKELSKICDLKDIFEKDSVFKFTVSHKNKKSVEKYLNKKNITILSRKKKGVWAFLRSSIFRVGVLASIFLFAIFTFVSNLFVFEYQILGNELVKTEEIVSVLKKCNVSGVTRKNKINKQEIEIAMQEIDKVSLASVVIKGNTLVVNIKEKVYNQEYEERDGFAPLCSNYNGIITEISLIQGTPLVKVGQTVKIGQKLVAPYVIDTSGNKLSVKPMADIKADVFLTTSHQVPNTKIEMVDTGNVLKGKKITLFGLQIFSNTKECNFKAYRCETTTTNMSNNVLLPVKIVATIIYEQKQKVTENYFDDNKEQILKDCQQKTRQLVGSCEIIKEEYNSISCVADVYHVSCTVIVNKSIC